jgi:hypothetical protein
LQGRVETCLRWGGYFHQGAKQSVKYKGAQERGWRGSSWEARIEEDSQKSFGRWEEGARHTLQSCLTGQWKQDLQVEVDVVSMLTVLDDEVAGLFYKHW